MIRFACPGCNATYTVEDSKAGKAGKCPKCAAQFVIPAADAGAFPAPPPTPPEPRRSPPPPPAPASDGAVEIKPCPKCGARLSVAASDLGVDVECPYCQAVYTAKRADAPDRPSRREAPAPRNEERPRSRHDEDDRPSRRGRRDEDDEDRPSRRRAAVADDEDDDRPSRRRRDDDEEEADDRPRKKKRRRSSTPHRGGLILGLGIASFVACGIFTAIPAWLMGSNDLKEMDAGRMDDSGRGLTQAGRIMGMVSTGLTVVVLLFYCVIIILAVAAGGANAAGGGVKGPGVQQRGR